MSHTPHELSEEFPDLADKIHELKVKDSHFARLLEDYHDVNRAVHRAESLVEPVSDAHDAELRRRRMQLKDQIARLLRSAMPG